MKWGVGVRELHAHSLPVVYFVSTYYSLFCGNENGVRVERIGHFLIQVRARGNLSKMTCIVLITYHSLFYDNDNGVKVERIGDFLI